MKMDGSCLHFFNRILNAYDSGKRKRRRIIATGDICDGVADGNSRWHKTGSSKPIFDENGVRIGWKKILVLYKGPKKVGGKPKRENWVMHQYHLGLKEDETNGQFVVCKVFYQLPSKKSDNSKTDVVVESVSSVAKINPRTPMTYPPQPRRLNNSPCNTEQYTPIQQDQVNLVIIFCSLISQFAAKYSLPPFISIGHIGRVHECKRFPVFRNCSVHID
jgi:hypothetical protein